MFYPRAAGFFFLFLTLISGCDISYLSISRPSQEKTIPLIPLKNRGPASELTEGNDFFFYPFEHSFRYYLRGLSDKECLKTSMDLSYSYKDTRYTLEGHRNCGQEKPFIRFDLKSHHRYFKASQLPFYIVFKNDEVKAGKKIEAFPTVIEGIELTGDPFSENIDITNRQIWDIQSGTHQLIRTNFLCNQACLFTDYNDDGITDFVYAKGNGLYLLYGGATFFTESARELLSAPGGRSNQIFNFLFHENKAALITTQGIFVKDIRSKKQVPLTYKIRPYRAPKGLEVCAFGNFKKKSEHGLILSGPLGHQFYCALKYDNETTCHPRSLGRHPAQRFHCHGSLDYNGDGMSDLLLSRKVKKEGRPFIENYMIMGSASFKAELSKTHGPIKFGEEKGSKSNSVLYILRDEFGKIRPVRPYSK